MTRLVITTLIWSFSFSLIGHYLAREVDTFIAIFCRFFLGSIIFVPLIDWSNVFTKEYAKTIAVGMIQGGLMYIFYFHSKTRLMIWVPSREWPPRSKKLSSIPTWEVPSTSSQIVAMFCSSSLLGAL